MPAICLGRHRLEDYSLGRLAGAAHREAEAHLDACADCGEALAAADRSSDTLLRLLHSPARGSDSADDPEYARAAAVAKRFAKDQVREAGPERGRAGANGSSAADPAPPGDVAASDPARVADLRQLRDYRLLRKLGEGGMGTVYKALHVRLNRVFALKVLPPDRMHDAQAVARFEREMRAIGRFDHPAIVRATDAGELDGTHFLVMEYVEGLDLSRLVERCGPLRLADACEIIRQAAIGLGHVHERGLVHRDVKPSNLMLSVVRGPSSVASDAAHPEPQRATDHRPRTAAQSEIRNSQSATVKILDLGLALLGGSPGTAYELTTVGQFMGTLDYIAPEQADDSHEVDPRADLYSLGATLYKLLTGHAPFAGPEFGSPVKKFKAVLLSPAPDVRERRPDVPAELAGLIARMLAKNPDERPGSAAEVARTLEGFCRGADLATLLAAAEKQEPRDPADAAHGGGISPVRGDGLSGDHRPDGRDPGAAPRRRRRRVRLVISAAAAGSWPPHRCLLSASRPTVASWSSARPIRTCRCWSSAAVNRSMTGSSSRARIGQASALASTKCC